MSKEYGPVTRFPRGGPAYRERRLLSHEILLLGIAGQVLKRQDRERWLVGERQRAGRSAESDSIAAHGPCDVLDLLLAEILEGGTSPGSRRPRCGNCAPL